MAVFTDPRYRDLDVPDWVQHVSDKAKVLRLFTVSRLIKAMYDTSGTPLGLKRGKVYVSAAICHACADDALKDPAEDAQPGLALAHGLGRKLASTWAAFFLAMTSSPVYGRTPSDAPISIDDISGNATPTRDMTEVMMSDGLQPDRSGTLRRDVLRRDGRKCTVTGDDDEEGSTPYPAPPGIFTSYLQYGEADNTKFRSMAATFEILQHYCQISDKYIKDMMAFVDTPENAFTIAERLHTPFDNLSWCLIPTATPHVYQFKDYSPNLESTHTHPIP
ncbi:hypothetical protein LXA43DRAFT_1065621 [Ganoderma leucocontextum]|nr:hypothetical protein LXA43DRAFT_1065621 [Ganoderma leucocontextum]